MVTIKILPSNFTPNLNEAAYTTSKLFAPQTSGLTVTNNQHNEDFTIVALAKACAATQIQALYRGVKCRQRTISSCNFHRKLSRSSKTCRQFDFCYYRKVQNAILTIQNFFRLIIHQRRGITLSLLECDHDKLIRHDVAGQTDWIYNERNDNDTQTDDLKEMLMHQSNQDENNNDNEIIKKRKDVVKFAYDSCRSKILGTITINGFEVLNILQAMSVLSYREYELLLKTLLSNSGSSAESKKYGHKSLYQIRLQGDIKEFESDINTAWLSLTKKAMELSPGSAVALRKKGTRLKPNSSSLVARTHLQQLVDLDNESLSILERNQDILSYDNRTINSFLESLGVGDLKHEVKESCTIIDYLNTFERSEDSSFVRTKVKAASEIIRYIKEWEKTLCSSYSEKDNFALLSQIIEKDEIISALKGQVAKLEQQLTLAIQPVSGDNRESKYMHREQARKHEHELNCISFLPFSCLEDIYKDSVRKINGGRRRTTQLASTSEKIEVDSNPSVAAHTSLYEPRLKRKSKQRRTAKQGYINRVDIKFGDLFEKETKSKVPSNDDKPLPSYSKSRIHEKHIDRKVRANTSKRDTAHESTLCERIQKSRDKRHLHQATKIAWSENEKEQIQSRLVESTSCDNEFFKVLKNCNKRDIPYDREIENLDGRAKINTNQRFNKILEKLRNTATSLES